MSGRKPDRGWATCWMVGHPELPTVPVTAESWEMATVGAAALWGVPWSAVAAECFCKERMEVKRGVCIKCHGVMYNRPGKDLCEVCEKKMKQDHEIVSARLKKTWYMAPKRA